MQVEVVVLESTATYHILYFEEFRRAGLDVIIVNPMMVKALLKVEGKSDKADSQTLAKLVANFPLRRGCGYFKF